MAVSPHQTLEEIYLAHQLMKGIGAARIDYRTHAAVLPQNPLDTAWLGQTLSELSAKQNIVLLGSTIRKEYPLIAQRLRQAVKQGARLSVIHSADDPLLTTVDAKIIIRPDAMVAALAQILQAVCH